MSADYGVGRYGLRTFKPAIVRGEPYLVSVSQDPIPPADPKLIVKKEWRELLTDSHPISWADGTCTAVCASSPRYKPNPEWKHGPVVPDENCNCGIYALDDLKDLHAEYRGQAKTVVAVISASGRTFEHRNGIKTQYARVVAYWVLDHHDGCVCELCRNQRLQHVLTPSNTRLTLRAEGFPWVQCCGRQFAAAERFGEPDEMALHFGLKATPIPAPPRVLKTRDDGPRTSVDLSPLANHAPGTPGHYQFEINT